jgi:hypothetical protein
MQLSHRYSPRLNRHTLNYLGTSVAQQARASTPVTSFVATPVVALLIHLDLQARQKIFWYAYFAGHGLQGNPKAKPLTYKAGGGDSIYPGPMHMQQVMFIPVHSRICHQ